MELHEQSWCPAAIRNGVTDCLHAVANLARQFQNVAPKLQHALDQTGAPCVVDLCSGGGGPWLNLYWRVRQRSGQPMPIVLTDLYPNVQAMRAAAQRSGQQICYIAAPVDATCMPEALVGFRTLFTAFHHFAPVQAQAILQDAIDHEQGIAIFEQTHRNAAALIMMLTLPWLALLVAPWIRPFRLSRLFWTYILPAIPLILCIDGMVSCLRTYSPDEMATLIAGLKPSPKGSTYVWESGRVRSPVSPLGVTYLIGYPDKKNTRTFTIDYDAAKRA
jgi:hypothetical protein